MSNSNQSGEVYAPLNIYASRVRLSSLVLPLLLTLLFSAVYLQNAAVILGVVVMSAVAVLADPVIGLCLYIATATSGNFFAFVVEGFSLSRLYGILYIVAVLLAGLWRPTRLRLRANSVGFAVILTALNLGSLSYALSPDGWWDAFVTMMLNITVFVMTVGYRWDDTGAARELCECMGITLVFFAALVIGGHGVFDLGSGRLSLSATVNPNDFAMSVAQLSVVPIIAFLGTRRMEKRLGWGLLLAISGFMLLSTGSRSSTFGLLLGVMFLVFSRNTSLHSFRGWKRGLLLVVLFGGLCLVWMVLGRLDQSVAGRYTVSSILQSQGTGRLIIWSNLLRYVIPQHLWFGVGLGGKNVIVSLANVVSTPYYLRPAHNIVIDLLTQLGVVGLLAYGCFFVLTYRRAVRASILYPAALPFVVIFVTSIGIGIGETMVSNKLLWVSAAVCWKYGSKDRSHAIKGEEQQLA